MPDMRQYRFRGGRIAACCFVLLGMAGAELRHPGFIYAQKPQITWTDRQKPLAERLNVLRNVPDDQRGAATRQLALDIRALPSSPNKLILAKGLALLSTEGDFGRDNIQEVANTLAEALRESPPAGKDGHPAEPYMELADLVRYEHVQTSLDSPDYAAAMAELEADDRRRQHADFTLTDMQGRSWTLQS
jgi:hypothetical protein